MDYLVKKKKNNSADEKKTIIKLDDVTVRFNMASERIDNLKEYVIKLAKRELMFKEFLALKNVTLDIKQGEAWGLIGVNGSGKSTLLKLISGILKPYRGKVTISGSIAPLIELGAGFDSDLTARENIFLNGAVLGHDDKFMQEHFDEIVEFAELQDFLDMPIKNYSSGMAARLGFAIATMVKTDILICDEVLSVGDFAFQQKCEERMHRMLEDGTTLIYVSHDISSVKRLCDHAIWLEKGREVMQGNALTVCDAYIKELVGDIQAAKEGDDFDYIIINNDGSYGNDGFFGNKPLELISKNQLPIIFYVIRRYPQKKFILIENERYDVIGKYISTFGGIQFVSIREKENNVHSIKKALKCIPENKRFMILNSNVVLDNGIFPEHTSGNVVGVSAHYPSGRFLENGKIKKRMDGKGNICNFFIVEDKALLNELEEGDDLIESISKLKMDFREFDLGNTKIVTKEEDTREEDLNFVSDFSGRSFNIIKTRGNIVTKLPQDDLGKLLAAQETMWYQKVTGLGYKNIPAIYSYDPISMMKIDGEPVYKADVDLKEKKTIIDGIFRALEDLHALGSKAVNVYSMKDVYFNATFSSLDAIKNIVPFTNSNQIRINGKACKNPFDIRNELGRVVQSLLIDGCDTFRLIHGDCTFSNILLGKDGAITFIDPQGCFGLTNYYGDVNYDWAKLYVSIAGGWDRFVNGNFTVSFHAGGVEVRPGSNEWAKLGDYFLSKLPKEDRLRVKLLYALIWLSSTMYKWNDYDSVCAAFYMGSYYTSPNLQRNKR